MYGNERTPANYRVALDLNVNLKLPDLFEIREILALVEGLIDRAKRPHEPSTPSEHDDGD